MSGPRERATVTAPRELRDPHQCEPAEHGERTGVTALRERAATRDEGVR